MDSRRKDRVHLRRCGEAFAKPGNEQGEWWNRERLALWLPPLSAGDPRLAWLLRRAGWLSPAEERSLHPSR